MEKFKELFRQALQKGLFHLLFSNFLVQFLGFGLILFLASYLSPRELGHLKLIHSYTAFFILLGCCGLNSAALKYCSEDISFSEKKACFSHAFKRVLQLSCISFILMVAFNHFYFVPTRAGNDLWPYIYSTAVLFAAPALLVMAFMQSQKKVKLAAKLQAIVRLLFVLVIFIAAINYGFWGIVIATAASYMVGLIIYIPFVKKELSFNTEYLNYRNFERYSLWIFLGALVTVLAQNIDIYLLGFFNVDSSEIGVYSVATLFFLSGTVLTGTIQTIITPYFSEKQGDLNWVREKANYYQKKLVFISIPISLLLGVASYLLVEFYFGEQYSKSIGLSFILILKYLVWSCFCVYGAVLFAIGVVKEGIYIIVIVLLVNVFVSYFLFSVIGGYGVATGQVISSLIHLFLVFILFNKKTLVRSAGVN